MRARTAVIATVVTAAVGGIGLYVVSPSSAGAPAGTHECAAATERCDGDVEVPLDWSKPDGEKISVSFAWIPRKDQSKPAAGTVFTIHGGPLPGLPHTDMYGRMLGPVLDQQNMLILDPRGLGESSPLECPGLNLDDPSDVGRCGQQLGDRVQFFTSDQAAQDFDAVRGAMGVESMSLYGTSYGTLWAQAYTSRFPERVRAMLLHDVVKTGEDGYAEWPLGRAVGAGQENLDTACERSEACRGISGDPRENWAELVERLRAKPDRALPVPMLIQLAHFTVPGAPRDLNAAVAAYLDGDQEPLHRLANPMKPIGAPGGGAPSAQQEADGGVPPAYFAYWCGDSAHPYSRSGSPEQREKELDATYAGKNPFGPFTVDEVRGTPFGDKNHADCLGWPTPRESPPVKPGPAPDVPVLAIGGDFDTATPVGNAVDTARKFPRGDVAINRFGAHSPEVIADSFGLTGEYWLCARQDVRTYLQNPERAGDLGCSAENYRAIGSFPRTSGELPKAGDGLGDGDHTAVASAFATAADTTALRNPYSPATMAPMEGPGLRGGQVRLPDPSSVELTGVRYVSDVEVSGKIRLDDKQMAHGELTVTGTDGAARRVTLDWPAFTAEGGTPVKGTIDGRAFEVRIPLT